MTGENILDTRPKGYVTGVFGPVWWAGTTVGKTSIMFQLHHPDHGWLTVFFSPEEAEWLAQALIKGSAMVREAAGSLPPSTVTEN
jgi:hypothetical protein